jgi:hypothetical protein
MTFRNGKLSRRVGLRVWTGLLKQVYFLIIKVSTEIPVFRLCKVGNKIFLKYIFSEFFTFSFNTNRSGLSVLLSH